MSKEKLEKVRSGLLQKMASRKRKGAILGFDSVNYLLVLIIFVGLGVAGLGALEGYRVITCKMELREISAAYATYQSLMVNKSTGDLSDLLKANAIAADNAVDGVVHGNFLKASGRWKESGLVDPWGNAYKLEGNYIVSEGGPLTNGTLEEAIGVDTN